MALPTFLSPYVDKLENWLHPIVTANGALIKPMADGTLAITQADGSSAPVSAAAGTASASSAAAPSNSAASTSNWWLFGGLVAAGLGVLYLIFKPGKKGARRRSSRKFSF